MARSAREHHEFYEPLFHLVGERVTGNLYGARLLAHRMNARRDLARFPELTVSAGRIYIMGLIEELLHVLVRTYVRSSAPDLFARALELLEGTHGGAVVGDSLVEVTRQFPPLAVYREKVPPEEYLRSRSGGTPHAEIVLEEALLLLLANRNPAYRPYRELFDDLHLAADPVYPGLFDFLSRFLREMPPYGPTGQSLLDMLQAPMRASPDSLEGQLEFLVQRWGDVLSPYMAQILTALDIVREEDKPVFTGFGGGEEVPDYQAIWLREQLDREDERFTPDRDWMSHVVMLAKSVWVWLHQLSVKYGREIARLDQVPDEELELLSRWGFTALWLIGIWERSTASREIKRRMGNPEAEASAYSLFDYQVAADLGGEEALLSLKERAWRHGLRLAADMVPNHTGIYSRWVRERPEWFIQTEAPPFPAYRFTGPDLSPDPSLDIRLEDGYWNRSDAAVVFRHQERESGRVRHIYHGNDGTGLPWNDTAQLNYLIPEVREAVMQAILHVARLCPVIRFDAAMTLTRRHYRRLWFPPPGTGGDIPSRAGQGLPPEEFDRLFPQEFWREVVDRVGREVPDTLLLAEAFWLLEGYFVRTLGMHRVYNSAFMNMLKREANAEYRQTIKNVLEFDPEILKRFVNFMNNPDEDTAVAQFGKGDKYFGVAVMLATMPGLPMFGHGQVEGFTEKYGMEYRRSYWDEEADGHLVRRHEREIFPLLRHRRLFSEAARFTLYDFYRSEGQVDENVFAYSNRSGEERCLVVYHNVYGHTSGWVRDSAAIMEKEGGERRLVRRTLGEELGLTCEPGYYVLFADVLHGLEYIRPCRDVVEEGLRIFLGAYGCHVFLHFRTIRDTSGEWGELCRLLEGRGVPSLREVLREVLLTPLHRAFRGFYNAETISSLALFAPGAPPEGVPATGPDRWAGDLHGFHQACREAEGRPGTAVPEGATVAEEILALLRAATTGGDVQPLPASALLEAAHDPLHLPRLAGALAAAAWLGWEGAGRPDPLRSSSLFEEWLLSREVERVWRELGVAPEVSTREILLLEILIRHRRWLAEAAEGDAAVSLESLLKDPKVQKFLGINRYQDVLWFVRERFEELVAWFCLISRAEAPEPGDGGPGRLAGKLVAVAEAAGYRLDHLLELAEDLLPE
jgi:glycosidase